MFSRAKWDISRTCAREKRKGEEASPPLRVLLSRDLLKSNNRRKDKKFRHPVLANVSQQLCGYQVPMCE